MEVIRGVVDDRSKGRSYHHRLMNYNNDPTTTLSDVQSLFSEALVMTNSASLLGPTVFRPKICDKIERKNSPSGVRTTTRGFRAVRPLNRVLL